MAPSTPAMIPATVTVAGVRPVTAVGIVHPIEMDAFLPLTPYRLIIGRGADSGVEGVAAMVKRLGAITDGIPGAAAGKKVPNVTIKRTGTLILVEAGSERGQM